MARRGAGRAAGNLLVVLGPPGATRIDYTACYRGRTFGVGGPGDALVRGVPELRGDISAPVSYDVVVVTAG